MADLHNNTDLFYQFVYTDFLFYVVVQSVMLRNFFFFFFFFFAQVLDRKD